MSKVSYKELQTELFKNDVFIQANFSDQWYIKLDYDYLVKDFLPWFRGYMFEIDWKYRPEAEDCDNAADLLMGQMKAAHARNPNYPEGDVCAAVIATEQKYTWADVPNGGYHALNMIYTNKGFVVVEPQNQKHTLLKDYPNREHIYEIRS